MKKLTLIFLMLATALYGISQTQQKKLPVHQKYRNFETSTTSLLPYFLNNPYDPEDKYYRGQRPRFCESLTYDCNGDLLFFIIDDKIYNKNGYSNDYLSCDNVYPNYLHLNNWCTYDAKGYGNFTNTEINPYDIAVDYNIAYSYELNYHFGSEIVVIPVPGHGGEYYLVYSLLKHGGGGTWGPSDIYYRKLTYDLSSDEISLTDPVCIKGYGINNAYSVHLAASPMTEDGDQYLFVNYADSLLVYDVNTLYGLTTNPVPVTRNRLPILSYEGDEAYREEMEVRIVEETGGTYFYLAVPFLTLIKNLQFNRIGLYKYSAQDASYVGSRFLTVNVLPSTNHYIKGLEFSANCENLFYTFQDQTNLYYLDLSFMETLGNVSTPQTFSLPANEYASDFEKSHYELGYDNALYIINGRTGNLKRFSTPANPASGTWSNVSGCTGLAISATYAGTSGSTGHYIITDQIDGGASYENYSESFNIDADFTKTTSCINNDIKIIATANSVYETNTWTIQECTSSGTPIGAVLETLTTQTNPVELLSTGSLNAFSYYKITHYVEDEYCNSATETKIVFILMPIATSNFTWEFVCINDAPAIRATAAAANLYNYVWRIYRSNSSGDLGSLIQTISGTQVVEFTGLDLGAYYKIRLDTYNCGSSNTIKLVNTYNTEWPANFSLTSYPSTETINANMSYPYINKVDHPNMHFLWRVEELDSYGDTITGTVMYNPSNWWNSGFYINLNFPGYDYPNFSSTALTPAGTFLVGHTYKITRGLWSSCNSWTAYSTTFTMGSKGLTILEEAVNDMEKPENPEDFGNALGVNIPSGIEINLYPVPANNILFIDILSSDNQKLEVNIYDMLGKQLLTSQVTSGINPVDISELSPGMYYGKVSSGNKLIKNIKFIKK